MEVRINGVRIPVRSVEISFGEDHQFSMGAFGYVRLPRPDPPAIVMELASDGIVALERVCDELRRRAWAL